MKSERPYFAHQTSLIEPGATVGAGAKIWHDCHIRNAAVIGESCVLGKGVFVDEQVTIGDSCKIQNYVCIYRGVRLGRGVFVGPHACFTNDLYPRAVNPDFSLKTAAEWTEGSTTVGDGASIGANATIVCGITIGSWAMVGAGCVVARDVPEFALVVGSPSRVIGWICPCGVRQPSQAQARDCSQKCRENQEILK